MPGMFTNRSIERTHCQAPDLIRPDPPPNTPVEAAEFLLTSGFGWRLAASARWRAVFVQDETLEDVAR